MEQLPGHVDICGDNSDDETGFYGEGPPITIIRCKFCNSPEVHWAKTPDGWRLFNDPGDLGGNKPGIHRCDKGKKYLNTKKV